MPGPQSIVSWAAIIPSNRLKLLPGGKWPEPGSWTLGTLGSGHTRATGPESGAHLRRLTTDMYITCSMRSLEWYFLTWMEFKVWALLNVENIRMLVSAPLSVGTSTSGPMWPGSNECRAWAMGTLLMLASHWSQNPILASDWLVLTTHMMWHVTRALWAPGNSWGLLIQGTLGPWLIESDRHPPQWRNIIPRSNWGLLLWCHEWGIKINLGQRMNEHCWHFNFWLTQKLNKGAKEERKYSFFHNSEGWAC